MHQGLVGSSLAYCVLDIQRDNVSLRVVERVLSPTHIQVPEEELEKTWRKLFEKYKESYWKEAPGDCEEIALRLLKTGRISQPLLVGRWPPLPSSLWMMNGRPVDRFIP
jgi:hypothetical protein